MVRRLPVVQSQAPEDEAAARRSSWRWWLIGVLSNLVFWLPLSLVAAWIGAGAAHAESGAVPWATVSTSLLSYAVACAVTGVMLGRFAPGLGAALAASTAVALAAGAGVLALSLGVVALVPVLLAVAVLSAAGSLGSVIGFFFGDRRRLRDTTAVDRR